MSAATLPRKALSIIQPWPWLIVNGFKDVENRDWSTNYRGPVLIHAGKKLDGDAWQDVSCGRHPVTGEEAEFLDHETIPELRGGIVGIAEIVDCVSRSDSPWFVGRYGFVVRNARPLPFMPCKGALGFLVPDLLDPAR